MASTPEGKVKTKVAKLLKDHGAYYFFAAMNGYGRSGVPDIIACMRGRFLAIECKAGKNTTTALQEREIKEIRAAGGWALVVNETNIGQVENLLRSIESEQDQDQDR